jgi:hypothetical protein
VKQKGSWGNKRIFHTAKESSNLQRYARLESMANGTANGTRYTRNQILNYILNNAADLAANGVDVHELYNWAAEKYTWEG